MQAEDIAVTRGRAVLHVRRWGSTGPVLLALHPGVGDSRIWDTCARRWAETGNRVVAYDRRGFGSTSAPPEAHDEVDDLLAVATATDVESAVVIGNSRGGGLALDLALSHPERVSALILIAPSPSGYEYDEWPTTTAEAEQDALIGAADDAEDLDLVNRLEARYWLDGVDQPEGRVTGAARELFLEMNGIALRASPTGDATTREPVWSQLSRIDVPVLVVAGEFDLPGIRNQCSELVTSLPNAELVEIPGAAHCPQLDQPDALVDVVREFLDRTPAT